MVIWVQPNYWRVEQLFGRPLFESCRWRDLSVGLEVAKLFDRRLLLSYPLASGAGPRGSPCFEYVPRVALKFPDCCNCIR